MSILSFVRSVRKVSKAADDWLSGRGLDDYDPLDESDEDKLTAQRNAAWARLFKVVVKRWREDVHTDRVLTEIEAAKENLFALGVDVDALLDVTP